MGEPQAHAPLPPSGATAWMECPRWPSMQRPQPDGDDNEAAREGTAAHDLLEQMMHGRVDVAPGEFAGNGVAITNDMIDASIEFRDRVWSLTTEPLIEAKVYMPRIHADCWGTLDCGWVDVPNRKIYVWDFKFGHRYVDAFRNYQLVAYAEGLVELWGLSPSHGFDMELAIYQPRNYDRSGHWRVWNTTGDEHRGMVDKLHLAAKLVSPRAQAKTGPQCRDCTGRAGCEALQRASMHAVEVSCEVTGIDIDNASLGAELEIITQAADRLKARKTALEEQAKAQLRTGSVVPGWTVEPGTKRERWTIPVDDVIALGQACELDLAKPGTLTPKQARDKGLDAEVSALYTERPPGEHKLVRVTEEKAARAFGNS